MAIVRAFEIWNATKNKGYELDILIQNSGSIDWMRNSLASSAVESGFDYILWLDTDMVFPTRSIIAMLESFEQDETLEAVTGLYTWKKPPFLPHVYHRFNEKTQKFKIAGGFPIDKIFKVEGAGFGILMMKTSVFSRVERPWFKIIENEEQIDYGEDLYFCKNAKMNMVCNPGISCRHLTEVGYDISSYVSYNDLEVKDGNINTTREQLNKIEKEHLKR